MATTRKTTKYVLQAARNSETDSKRNHPSRAIQPDQQPKEASTTTSQQANMKYSGRAPNKIRNTSINDVCIPSMLWVSQPMGLSNPAWIRAIQPNIDQGYPTHVACTMFCKPITTHGQELSNPWPLFLLMHQHEHDMLELFCMFRQQ